MNPLCRRVVASLRAWRTCSCSSSSPSSASAALMGSSLGDPPQLSPLGTVKLSASSPAEDLPRISLGNRPFPSSSSSSSSSLASKWHSFTVRDPSPLHQIPVPHMLQQARHVYVEVIDNDIDAAVKVYRKKMLNTKIEDKLREKRYYSKPSERRKLAKHYKKLNRARRELTAKIRTVKHRMEKIQEVRKIEKEEKRAKAAAAAAAASQGSKSNGR